MTSRFRHLLLLFLALIVGACQDVPSAPKAQPISAAASVNGLAMRDTLSEYGCYISSVNPEQPGRWHYGQTGLRFPAGALARDTAKLLYRFRRRAPDGTPVRVANCVIPRTRQAVAMMNRWLKVSPNTRNRDDGREGDAVLLSDTHCTDMSNGDGVCTIEGLDAIAEPPDDGGVDSSGSGATPIPTAPLSPDGGSGPGSPTTSEPCLQCTYGSANLTCTNMVTRGSTVSCRVNTSDLRNTSARNWKFTPASSSGMTFTISGPASGLSWAGTGVIGGTVEAEITDRAGTRVVTYDFGVGQRGWTWASKGVSIYSDGTGTPCYTGTPDNEHPNGWNQGMNLTNPCAGDEKFIQPDSDGSPDANGPTDGFTISPAITSGPNKGLFYVTNATLYLRRKSAYNPSLFPDAFRQLLGGWNNNHCPGYEISANFHQFNRCKGVDVDVYINGIRGHEGEGWNGGIGHYSAALKLVSEPANDPMRFLDEWVSRSGESRDDFLTRLREEFHTRMRPVERGARPNASAGGLSTGNWYGSVYLWTRSSETFERYTYGF